MRVAGEGEIVAHRRGKRPRRAARKARGSARRCPPREARAPLRRAPRREKFASRLFGRSTSDRDRAVPVAVGLYDDAQPGGRHEALQGGRRSRRARRDRSSRRPGASPGHPGLLTRASGGSENPEARRAPRRRALAESRPRRAPPAVLAVPGESVHSCAARAAAAKRRRAPARGTPRSSLTAHRRSPRSRAPASPTIRAAPRRWGRRRRWSGPSTTLSRVPRSRATGQPRRDRDRAGHPRDGRTRRHGE